MYKHVHVMYIILRHKCILRIQAFTRRKDTQVMFIEVIIIKENEEFMKRKGIKILLY